MRAIRGLSFFVDDECFAVDVSQVAKVERKLAVTPVPAAPGGVEGIANLKGRVLTILSISALRGKKTDTGAWRGTWKTNAVIFKPFFGEGDQMGLVIDKAADLIEIDEDKIMPPPMAEDGISYVAGVAETGGVFYRIIDMDSIIRRFTDEGIRYAGETPGRYIE